MGDDANERTLFVPASWAPSDPEPPSDKDSGIRRWVFLLVLGSALMAVGFVGVRLLVTAPDTAVTEASDASPPSDPPPAAATPSAVPVVEASNVEGSTREGRTVPDPSEVTHASPTSEASAIPSVVPAPPPTVAATPDERSDDPQYEFVNPRDLPTYRVVDVPGNDVLNVRTAPGTGNPIVWELEPWAQNIQRTGRAGHDDGAAWWEIHTPAGSTGWVSARYLEPMQVNGEEADTVPLYRVIDVPSDDVLNIRSGPGPDFPIIGEFAHDQRNIYATSRTDTAEDGEWWEVYFDGGTGWSHSDYLQFDGWG